MLVIYIPLRECGANRNSPNFNTHSQYHVVLRTFLSTSLLTSPGTPRNELSVMNKDISKENIVFNNLKQKFKQCLHLSDVEKQIHLIP